jgi:hypothetical protein
VPAGCEPDAAVATDVTVTESLVKLVSKTCAGGINPPLSTGYTPATFTEAVWVNNTWPRRVEVPGEVKFETCTPVGPGIVRGHSCPEISTVVWAWLNK